jgi:hypothetical protein
VTPTGFVLNPREPAVLSQRQGVLGAAEQTASFPPHAEHVVWKWHYTQSLGYFCAGIQNWRFWWTKRLKLVPVTVS